MNIMKVVLDLFQTPEIEAASPPPAADAETEKEEEEEEELKDPMEELREECTNEKEISELFKILGECSDRVNSKEKTAETCEQELFDYVHERDHCVSKKLFDRLK